MRDMQYFVNQLNPQFLLEFSNHAPIGKIKPLFLLLIQKFYDGNGIESALKVYNRGIKILEKRGGTIFID